MPGRPPPSWSYGVTTVPSRFRTLLPQTLDSLAAAGFPQPHLFIDGCKESEVPPQYQSWKFTVRREVLRTYGNWMLV